MKRILTIGLPVLLLIILTLAGCGDKTQYTLNITTENGPGCTVTPASGTAYPAGTIIELTASGATGYVLAHWGGTDGASVSSENTIVMDGNKNITAVFARLQYDLTVNLSPVAGGVVQAALVIQPRSVYGIKHGEMVQLIAKPNPGYVFDHWEGGLTGSKNPATLTLTEQPSQAVIACFAPVLHGHVLGINTHRGVAGVTITADGRSTTTDANGFWQLNGVTFPTTVTASVSASSGYMNAAFSPASVSVNTLSEADIQIAMSAYAFEKSWGSPGGDDGQFYRPHGIAVGAMGQIYVSDTYNDRIQQFDASGFFLSKWGSYGSADGQLCFARGLAVDASGNVYVVESQNHRIQKFSSDGTYLAKWGSNGSGNGQFSFPQGIAVDAAGNVYVADSDNYRIQKFTGDGTYLGQWGSFGVADGQFCKPVSIAVDYEGYVYVADMSVSRVQKFRTDGTFVTKWGTYGTGNGQFDYLAGIAVDNAGNVYVTDGKNSRIQKFSVDGTHLGQWCSYGTGNGQLDNPVGIAVDGAGNIYVVDSNNNRIQKLRLVD